MIVFNVVVLLLRDCINAERIILNHYYQAEELCTRDCVVSGCGVNYERVPRPEEDK